MNQHWGIRLGDVVEIKGGGTPATSNSAFWDGDIPWVSPKDMKSWVISDAQDKITHEAIAGSATNLIPARSILVVNRSGILKHTLPVGITDREVAINQDIKALICGPMVDPSYLAHIVKAAEPIVLGWVRATTADNFPVDSLRNLEIPFPSLDEQQRIAAILDKADALRQKRKRAITLLDSLTQSIFLEMFGHPATNPLGLPIFKFGEIGQLDRGVSRHRPRNDPALLGGEHALIQTGDVANSGGYIISHNSSYSDLGLAQSKKWPAGTLCITIAANIANTGILEFDACFPDSVVGFSTDQPGLTEYVRVWLSFLKDNLERMAPASAQKNINLQVLRELSMPFPSASGVAEFGLRMRQLRTASLRLVRAEEIAKNVFTSLQHHAFSGQL